ncbi:MAG: septum formation family protein [Aeromicrobium sp.]|uniref:septum formation family protein n=1 Tax=Aeromicrobium sp. TaxID=1871063 RepID=UPI0039E33A52
MRPLLALLVALAVGGCSIIDSSKETARDGDGRIIGHNDKASAYEIQVGDCYDLPGDTPTVTTMRAVPCDEPHEAEAYHQTTLDGDDYPGEEVARETSGAACVDAFEDFVGRPYEDSELDVYRLYPRADSWDLLDDRLVSCLVYDPADPTLDGTLEGSDR